MELNMQELNTWGLHIKYQTESGQVRWGRVYRVQDGQVTLLKRAMDRTNIVISTDQIIDQPPLQSRYVLGNWGRQGKASHIMYARYQEAEGELMTVSVSPICQGSYSRGGLSQSTESMGVYIIEWAVAPENVSCLKCQKRLEESQTLREKIEEEAKCI